MRVGVLLPLSPLHTIVIVSGAGGGPTVLDAAERSTLLTHIDRRAVAQHSCGKIAGPGGNAAVHCNKLALKGSRH
jgi:hypothetical protein